MRDYLGDLTRFDAVIERQVEVARHLDRLVARDEDGERHDAAVPRRKTRALPQVAQKSVLRVLLKGWGDRPDLVKR